MPRINAICYFCKGENKDYEKGKIIKTKDGSRAFKCIECLEFDKEYEK
jgi:Zn-finger protein